MPAFISCCILDDDGYQFYIAVQMCQEAQRRAGKTNLFTSYGDVRESAAGPPQTLAIQNIQKRYK